MRKKDFFILSEEQIDKIGNAIIYLTNAIGEMHKTKILKLIYILDEISIKKSGIPFFNIPYKAWKYGPVSEDIFVDITTDLSKLSPFIEKTNNDTFIAKSDFNDDEFSNNDIKLMNYVIATFGASSAKELVNFTHRENAPWYNVAVENNILELLLDETISNTEFLIDFSSLISHDERKMKIYNDYLEMH